MTEERGPRWESIGIRIREARVRAGMTQAEVAKLVGVSPHAVWAWEHGRAKPSHEHLLELAHRCEVTTDWLLGRDVVEAEVLKEMDFSFRKAVEGLPTEDLESIWEFIRFVRERERRRRRR